MKKTTLIAAMFLTAAVGQTSTVAVSVGSFIINFNKLLKTVVSVGLGTSTVASGVAAIPVSMVTSRIPAASLQFDVIYNNDDVTAISVTAGPTATAAGKTAQCSTVTPGDFRCLIVGTNTTAMTNGVVANVSVTPKKSTVITIQGLVASSANASALSTAVSSPTSTITLTPIVQNVTCVVPAYDAGLPANTYNIEPGESVLCTVSLNQAAGTGGFTAPISANAPGLTLPATVLVPASQSSAQFTAVGQ